MRYVYVLFVMFFSVFGLNQDTSFVVLRHDEPDVALADAFVDEIHAQYTHLRTHEFFERSVRVQRAAFEKQCAAFGAYEQVMSTLDGHQIRFFHVRRGGQSVVVCAGGFPERCQSVAHLAAIFEPYDMLFFDFRWANEPGYFSSWSMLLRPYKTAIFDCVADVQAMLSYAHSCGYKQVIGAGTCYGSGLFVLAQEAALDGHVPGFDKLILESCWLSMQAFADNFIRDPYLATRWGRGGAPHWVRAVTGSFPLYHIFRVLAYLTLPHFGIDEHVKRLGDTPILFFHGHNDVLVSLDKFDQLWKTASHTSVAVLTPYHHSNNSTKAREVFAYLACRFIEQNYREFCAQVNQETRVA